MKKQKIKVCLKGERYGEPGALIETIKRTLVTKAIGNFNPIFCAYKGGKYLVSSEEGDLSDPFRMKESYLETLYIEVQDKGQKRMEG